MCSSDLLLPAGLFLAGFRHQIKLRGDGLDEFLDHLLNGLPVLGFQQGRRDAHGHGEQWNQGQQRGVGQGGGADGALVDFVFLASFLA